MGKGLIKSHLGQGLYSIELKYNRSRVDSDIAKLQRGIEQVNKDIAKVPLGDPDQKIPLLKLRKASLKKQLAYLQGVPANPTVGA